MSTSYGSTLFALLSLNSQYDTVWMKLFVKFADVRLEFSILDSLDDFFLLSLQMSIFMCAFLALVEFTFSR